MDKKKDLKRKTKRPYVNPRVTILHPDKEEARELGKALASGAARECKEIFAELRSKASKAKKDRKSA